MQLTETQQMIRSTIRDYLAREVEPLVPEMESERLLRDAKLIELGGGTTEIQELTAGRWLVEHYEI